MKEGSNLLVLFGNDGFDQIPSSWRELRAQLRDQSCFEKMLSAHTSVPLAYQPPVNWRYIPKLDRWLKGDTSQGNATTWLLWLRENKGGGISDRRLKQFLEGLVVTAKKVGATGITIHFPTSLPERRKRSWKRSATGKRWRLVFRWMAKLERRTGVLVGGFGFPEWKARA